MPTDVHVVRPLTFGDQPWVAGIDTLADLDWLKSCPDGRQRVAMIYALDATPEAIELIVQPLRNVVKLALEDPEPEGKFEIYGMLRIISTVRQAPVWYDGKTLIHFEEVLKKHLDRLKRRFYTIPKTITVFMEHLTADARYYLEQDKPNA